MIQSIYAELKINDNEYSCAHRPTAGNIPRLQYNGHTVIVCRPCYVEYSRLRADIMQADISNELKKLSDCLQTHHTAITTMQEVINELKLQPMRALLMSYQTSLDLAVSQLAELKKTRIDDAVLAID